MLTPVSTRPELPRSRRREFILHVVRVAFVASAGAAAACNDPVAPTRQARRDLGPGDFPGIPSGPPDETCAEKSARLGFTVWCNDGSVDDVITLPTADALRLSADSTSVGPGSLVTFTASAASGLPVVTRSWMWVRDAAPDPLDPLPAPPTFVACAGSVTCTVRVDAPGRMLVAGYVGALPDIQQTGVRVDTGAADGRLVCSPSTVVRGDTIACTVTGVRIVKEWMFTPDSASLPEVVRSKMTGDAAEKTWRGPLVVSGTVSVTAGSRTLTTRVTATPRN